MKYYCAAAGILALLIFSTAASAQCTSCGQVAPTTNVSPVVDECGCGGAAPCGAICGRCGDRCCRSLGCRRCGMGGCPQAWHGAYYGPWTGSCGAPLALVVPPTAQFKTRWSWGVGGTQVVPINAQFQRGGYYPPSPSGAGMGGGFYPTPQWPSSTDQFGVYYVRGPW